MGETGASPDRVMELLPGSANSSGEPRSVTPPLRFGRELEHNRAPTEPDSAPDSSATAENGGPSGAVPLLASPLKEESAKSSGAATQWHPVAEIPPVAKGNPRDSAQNTAALTDLKKAASAPEGRSRLRSSWDNIGPTAPSEEEKEKGDKSPGKSMTTALSMKAAFEPTETPSGSRLSLEDDAVVSDDPKQPTKPWYILNDDCFFRICWDTSQIFVLLYVSIMVPVSVAFKVEAEGLALWLEVFVDVYFVFDIFLNFVTSFKKGTDHDFVREPEYDIRKIAFHYLSTWLLIDILACLPLGYLSRAQAGTLACGFTLDGCDDSDKEDAASGNTSAPLLKLLKLFRLFRLLKMLRLFRVARLMARYEDSLVYWQHFLMVLKLTCVILLLSHWLGCMLGSVHDWSEDDVNYPYLYDKYLVCFYWATQTMTTVGYGDVDVSSHEERVVAIFGMGMGGFTFSWLVSSIFRVLNPDPQQKKHKETILWLVSYLRMNQIPRVLAGQVLGFYRKKPVVYDEQQLLASLPGPIRVEITQFMFGSTLRACSCFAPEPDTFFRRVCILGRSDLRLRWEMVWSRNDVAKHVHLLVKGEVVVLSNVMQFMLAQGMLCDKDMRAMLSSPEERAASEVVMEDITTPGVLFGECSLYGVETHVDFAVATHAVTLVSIPEQALKDVLDEYPAASGKLLDQYLGRVAKQPNRKQQKALIAHVDVKEVKDLTGGLRKDWAERMEKVKEAKAMEKMAGIMKLGFGVGPSDSGAAATNPMLALMGGKPAPSPSPAQAKGGSGAAAAGVGGGGGDDALRRDVQEMKASIDQLAHQQRQMLSMLQALAKHEGLSVDLGKKEELLTSPSSEHDVLATDIVRSIENQSEVQVLDAGRAPSPPPQTLLGFDSGTKAAAPDASRAAPTPGKKKSLWQTKVKAQIT